MEKITDIKQISDETLKECKASVVVDFINEKLQEANSKYTTEQEKVKQAEKSLTDTKTELEQVKASLQTIQDKLNAKEANETFNQRMTYFDDTYELSKEERKAIAEEIAVEKNIVQEVFDKIKNRYDILLKDKSKAAIAAKKEVSTSTASDNTNTANTTNNVVKDALNNGQSTNTATLPNAAAPETSFADKWAEAFKVENCVEVQKR